MGAQMKKRVRPTLACRIGEYDIGVEKQVRVADAGEDERESRPSNRAGPAGRQLADLAARLTASSRL